MGKTLEIKRPRLEQTTQLTPDDCSAANQTELASVSERNERNENTKLGSKYIHEEVFMHFQKTDLAFAHRPKRVMGERRESDSGASSRRSGAIDLLVLLSGFPDTVALAADPR